MAATNLGMKCSLQTQSNEGSKAGEGRHPVEGFRMNNEPHLLPKAVQKQKKRLCFPWQTVVTDLRVKQEVTLVFNKNLIKAEFDDDNELVVYWLTFTLV